MDDLITRSIARLVIPFIQVFGIYIVLNGHLSPGGGFAGGTVIAASFILYALAYDLKGGEGRLPHSTGALMESGGGLWYILVGLVGILTGAGYLANKSAGFPLGTAGNLFSSGAVVLITLGIGVKVASTMVTLYFNLVGEGENHDPDANH